MGGPWALRGPWAGLGILDVLKGLVPTWVALRALGPLLAALCGLAVVCGHIWSPFLRGRGGKGVAASLGAMLPVARWFALVRLVVVGVAVAVLRTTGLASVLACVALIVRAGAPADLAGGALARCLGRRAGRPCSRAGRPQHPGVGAPPRP